MSAAGRGLLAAIALLTAAGPLSAQVAPGTRIETLALSPEPGERIPEDAVLVAASFIDRDV